MATVIILPENLVKKLRQLLSEVGTTFTYQDVMRVLGVHRVTAYDLVKKMKTYKIIEEKAVISDGKARKVFKIKDEIVQALEEI